MSSYLLPFNTCKSMLLREYCWMLPHDNQHYFSLTLCGLAYSVEGGVGWMRKAGWSWLTDFHLCSSLGVMRTALWPLGVLDCLLEPSQMSSLLSDWDTRWFHGPKFERFGQSVKDSRWQGRMRNQALYLTEMFLPAFSAPKSISLLKKSCTGLNKNGTLILETSWFQILKG